MVGLTVLEARLEQADLLKKVREFSRGYSLRIN